MTAATTGLASTFKRFAGISLLARLRCEVFASIMRQELGFHNRTHSGELLSRLSGDLTTAGDVITYGLC